MAIDGREKSYSFMEFPLNMKRQDAFPLDQTSVYYSLEEAQSYASGNPTAYVGQILSVVVDGKSTAYQIKDAAGTLEALGAAVDVASDGEVEAMLDEVFGG